MPTLYIFDELLSSREDPDAIQTSHTLVNHLPAAALAWIEHVHANPDDLWIDEATDVSPGDYRVNVANPPQWSRYYRFTFGER
jgi:hypothetical protein